MSHAQPLHTRPGQPPGGRHPWGLTFVVGLHALVGWAIIDGLGQRMVDVIRPPLDTHILPDQPPPPPKPLPNLPQPRVTQPQQNFVEPPVIPAPMPTGPTITASHEPALPTTPWVESTVAPALPSSSVAGTAIAARPAIANARACAPTGDDYPPTARRAEATGITRLRFTIDATGALVRSDIIRSAGPTREHRLLDKVAESKLAGCVFTAGVDETGRAVGGSFDVEYVWRLE